MESAFSCTFTSAQVSEFFNRRKNVAESWHTHYLYLVAVRNATGASASLIPESLVMHASPELRPVLASQYDRKRSDFVVHALKITQWAQTYEDNEKRAPRAGKAMVAEATTTRQHTDTRTCNLFNTVGHIARQRRDATMGTDRTGSRKSHRQRLDRRLWRKYPSGER